METLGHFCVWQRQCRHTSPAFLSCQRGVVAGIQRINQYRLPAYHRLDVSAVLTPKKNEGRKYKTEWVSAFTMHTAVRILILSISTRKAVHITDH